MFENLDKYNIVLASNSPRRRELLQELNIDFTVRVLEGIDETFPQDLKPKLIPEYLAVKKAEAYRQLLRDEPNTLLITADTVVISDRTILGKPTDNTDALRMLLSLQGRAHKVISGVALTTVDKQVSFSVKTKVLMRSMSADMLQWYVDRYQPTDKAGAYGIQEWIGLAAIDHIEGSFHNVMGLPTQRLFFELINF